MPQAEHQVLCSFQLLLLPIRNHYNTLGDTCQSTYKKITGKNFRMNQNRKNSLANRGNIVGDRGSQRKHSGG